MMLSLALAMNASILPSALRPLGATAPARANTVGRRDSEDSVWIRPTYCGHCGAVFTVSSRHTPQYCSFQCRFWARVETRGGPDACWPWMLSRNKDGYGDVTFPNPYGIRIASRLAWIISNGPVPEDRPHILHSCDSPPCCNPRHLSAGTQKENVADMMRRARWRNNSPRGPSSPIARLTPELIATIRLMRKDGMSLREIRNACGVSNGSIYNAVTKYVGRPEWGG